MCKVNGKPIELLEPKPLREKAYEPILLLGKKKFADVDVRIRVKGGGSVAQTYAIRQSIAKGIVSFYQKCKFFSKVFSNILFFVSLEDETIPFLKFEIMRLRENLF